MNAFYNQWLVWRMAIVKAALLAFVAGFTTFQTSLNGLEWNLVSPTQRWLLIGGVAVSVANNLISFLDRTISRIESQIGGSTLSDPKPPTP